MKIARIGALLFSSSSKKWEIVCVFIALSFIYGLAYFLSTKVLTVEIVYGSLTEKFTTGEALSILKRKVAIDDTVIYIFQFIGNTIRLLAISLIIYVGFVLKSIEIKYSNIFLVVLICDIVHLAPLVIKLFHFSSSDTFSLDQFNEYASLSLVDVLDFQQARLQYTLAQFAPFNLYEVIFCLLAATLIAISGYCDFIKSLAAVVPPYMFCLFVFCLSKAYLISLFYD